MKSLRILGIDENGLGPFLGPLVVTGTVIKSYSDNNPWYGEIKDSKLFFKGRALKNFSLLEETVISIFFLLKKRMPESPLEIFSEFCGSFKCSDGEDICAGKIPSEFLWADLREAKKKCGEFSVWAEVSEIHLDKIYSDFICPRNFNIFTKSNNKLLLDLKSFCRIMEMACEQGNMKVQAGKIGGLKFYSSVLRYFMNDYEINILSEDENKSIYLLEKGNRSLELGFFMDVENKSFAASISSIAGKYIRELSMLSIRQNLGIKEDISGYHDAKSKKFFCSSSYRKYCSDCVVRRK